MPDPKSQFLCTECDLTLPSKKGLRKHHLEKHRLTYNCHLCKLEFLERKMFKIHKSEVHTPSHHCSKCSLVFSSRGRLRKHDRATHLASISCPLCSDRFYKEKEARSHKRKAHPACGDCKKRHIGPEELLEHQHETGHLRCPECDLYFPSRDDHTNHVREVQHRIQYLCCDCKREYPEKKALSNHCCDCDKILMSRKILNKHFLKPSHLRNATAQLPQPKDHQTQSNESLSHKCTKCDEKFISWSALKKHMVSKHVPQRNIPCPVGAECTKKFASPSALMNHLESGHCHSGMTRDKMTELVFAHDTNRYITNIDAASKFAPSELSSTHEIVSPQPLISAPHSPPTRLVEDLTIADDDDDASSEWSLINGGVPLIRPNPIDVDTTSEAAASEWSLIQSLSGAPLTSTNPIEFDNISEWSLTSGNLVLTPSLSVSSSNSISLNTTANQNLNLTCPLCPPPLPYLLKNQKNPKPFLTPQALHAHLNSAAHSPKIYHCPLSFIQEMFANDLNVGGVTTEKLRKSKEFKTLGGLMQHLENGACEGGVEIYKLAMGFAEEKLEGLGVLGVRLVGV